LINSWKKKLAITDLGLGKTHDKYLNIPKKAFSGTDQNPTEFYNTEPGRPDNHVFVNHIDKKTGDIYKVRFEYAKKSKQTRLYQLAGCYHARKPKPGDQIIVEKILTEGKFFFIVDIIGNDGSSLPVLSKDEIIHLPQKKFEYIKKPNINVFLETTEEPLYEKYRRGKSRKADDIIPQAEIYKTTFKILNKTFVYVGQDSYCSGENYYFGSSRIIGFVQLIYGDKIFKKEILYTYKSIKQRELNEKEWDCIRDARLEAKKKKDWHTINHRIQ
jgi:hypothetical protein